MKHGDATLGIPDGSQMFEFSYRLADEPGKVKAEAAQRVEEALEKAARQKRLGEMDASPHVLHSLDPLAGVDIAEVKRLYGDRVCLIGNVNCGLMDSDTEDEVVESARYALRQGMPGGGYIFSTSNCIYTGMPLSSYERMLEVRRVEGNYPGTGKD
ncbi:MAG TPA: uroporphyrinogen decarboxylase family protein [Anaerolineales bacterium]